MDKTLIFNNSSHTRLKLPNNKWKFMTKAPTHTWLFHPLTTLSPYERRTKIDTVPTQPVHKDKTCHDMVDQLSDKLREPSNTQV